jgi:hypothetical protein
VICIAHLGPPPLRQTPPGFPSPCGEGLGVGVSTKERASCGEIGRTSSADFACLSGRPVVEVDGETHSTNAELNRDARREQHLYKQGFRVVRFWNSDAMQNIEGVMDTVVAALHTPTPDPSPRRVEDAPSARWGGEVPGRALGELS